MNGFKIFGGSSHPEFTDGVLRTLGVPLGQARIGCFSDGEPDVEILESVRGLLAFVVSSICPPNTAQNLVELAAIIDALRRASAARICAVVPYFGLLRQDACGPDVRTPVTARIAADLLERVGLDQLLLVEPHSKQTTGFFTIPCDRLYPRRVMVSSLQNNPFIAESRAAGRLVVASPDSGGVPRALSYAEALGVDFAIAFKRRPRPGEARVIAVVGDVSGKDVLTVDDMADRFGTLDESSLAFAEHGAASIQACVMHPVLSGPAMDRLDGSRVRVLHTGNTIPPWGPRQSPKVQRIDLSGLAGEAVKCLLDGGSIHNLCRMPTAI